MQTSDILTLAKAGFTAEQIAALASVAAPAEPAAPVAPAAPATPEAPAAPAADPVFDKLLAQMQGLTQAVQSNGIMQSAQPQQQTAEDVLASIINPPKKEV